MDSEKIQIYIGGTKRSGKTTLARNLARELAIKGFRPNVVDVDEVRTEIFGGLHGAPDSEKSRRDHAFTLKTMFESLIPRLTSVGATPITISGFSSKEQYESTKAVAKKSGARFVFLLLDPPTLAEAAERARHATADDKSDMKDFSDPNTRASFQASVERIKHSYTGVTDKELFRVQQGNRVAMTEKALEFILSKA